MVDVNVDEVGFPLEGVGYFFEGGRVAFAGAAPGCGEFGNDDAFLEVICVFAGDIRDHGFLVLRGLRGFSAMSLRNAFSE